MQERILPSYPLFVKDPNFSLWSNHEILNENNVRAWWGEEKPVYGFIRTGGETYCFLGKADDFSACGVKKAEQVSLEITAFSTDYTFKVGKETLSVKFVSPVPPDDLELLSMPVCYLKYEFSGKDASVFLFVDRRIAYNAYLEKDPETWYGACKQDGFETAFTGRKRQYPLSATGDLIGADWGYFYLSGEKAQAMDEKQAAAYLLGKDVSDTETGIGRYLFAGNDKKSGILMIGYDDLYSIDYFGRALKGYYLEDHTIFDALESVWKDYRKIDAQLVAFDEKLQKDSQPFGEEYKNVLYASLRQCVGAHKLVRDENGEVLFLSKECNSNGCIGTVDVSYPSMPLFLLYNAELVKGMMRPILKFARLPVWEYDFAPHDVGTYPACCGQVYGTRGKHDKYFGNLQSKGYASEATHYPYYNLPKGFDLYDLKYQMPVEECGNLLIMFYAIYRADGDLSFFERHEDLCKKWVVYLEEYGLKPENQLCTDDFAGHLKNNINLAIKAAVGIAVFAELEKALGKDGKKYRATAEKFAKEITAFGMKYSHLPLTWDSGEETFSLKYNLAWDKIYGLHLFDQTFLEREVDYYLAHAEKYGIALDTRSTYAKSDWQAWAAVLSDSVEKRRKFISYLDEFLRTSSDREPFPDWYDVKSGVRYHFRARTVQGGCFILLMK